uniref:cytochrome c oxidase subunit II n=1 Tax=Porotermes planiceps TaxID=137007 RepID=UPI002551CE6A|nr:cytochrome c oxidase subunit II [Porotermes planiceps]UYX57314.1 cytochrome c oxidase subunit II [Porotermes planiceps]WHM51955.1 cytochrome c oxidase subunit II [Porotermes planiceps]
MTVWAGMNLQDSASPIMEQLTFFHDHTLTIILMILVVVTYMFAMLMQNDYIDRYMLESQMIELLWTILPAIILIFIATPSLRLLYLMDEIHNPLLTLSAIGHQWYWSYEYSDFTKVEFDSYMMPLEEINGFRLLDTDNRVILPMNSHIRIIVTAADVLHSWTVPSLGIKVDATPGRLNQTNFLINRPGLFYGQCSEICGANHSFMPIVIESISTNDFTEWISELSE